MSRKPQPSQASKRAERQAAARRQRKIRTWLIGSVVALVSVVGIWVISSRLTPSDPSVGRPIGVQDDLGIPVGTATVPVLDLYEDFQCPACKDLELNVGPALRQLAADGKVKIVYHILSFLDRNLRNDSSLRSANAAGCAQDQGNFGMFHDLVYENQPVTEGDGFTDEQLVGFARDAGVADMATFQTCMADGTHNNWVKQVQLRASDKQVTGTPTLFLEGERVDLTDGTTWEDVTILLTSMIEAAGGG